MFRQLKNICPPILWDFIKKNSGYVKKAYWEYLPNGFDTPLKTRGWNLKPIVDQYVERWPEFARITLSELPFGINPEATDASIDLITHNTVLCYAYVLTLAAQGKKSFRVLDWGGGIGHYGLIAEKLLASAEIKLEYHCYDMPLFCEAGAQINPHYHYFHEADYITDKKFDLVFASSSIWYERDWKAIIAKLANATQQYLYITRMIFISGTDSYVAIQRMPGSTEYFCWILNQNELINYVKQLGFEFLKEVHISHSYPIFKAPEQGEYKGFIFKRA